MAGLDLPRLTSLRAFAALAVFGYHIGKDTPWGPGGTTMRLGFVGVGFFFILSGFVLTWSTRPGTTARRFWTRRFARVYPSHFVMYLVAFVVPVLPFAVNQAAAVTNPLLIQAWFPQWPIAFGMNAVSWSLSCEAFFYLCAPFLMRRAHRMTDRQLVAAFGGWFLLMSAVAMVAGFEGSFDIYAYTNPLVRSGEFALGILAAMLVLRGRVQRIPVTAAVALVAGAWSLLNFRLLPQSVVDVCFDIPFLLLVLAGATTDLSGRRGVLSHRSLVYAGQVSFCFYLVHELVILNGGLIWNDWATSKLQAVVLAAAVLAVAFACAAALHHLVEKPCQRWIRRRWDAAEPAAV